MEAMVQNEINERTKTPEDKAEFVEELKAEEAYIRKELPKKGLVEGSVEANKEIQGLINIITLREEIENDLSLDDIADNVAEGNEIDQDIPLQASSQYIYKQFQTEP